MKKNKKNTYDGHRSTVLAFDELHYLTLIYTQEQLSKMWNEANPAFNSKNSNVIITSTPKK